MRRWWFLLTLRLFFSPVIRAAAKFGVEKVQRDGALTTVNWSNLGREVRRDEACEWAKHWLRDRNTGYKDSQVHLVCELFYHAHVKRG